MNFSLYLTCALVIQRCTSTIGCSWCPESQIDCLKIEHQKYGMKWKNGLAKHAQIYAEKANEKKAGSTARLAKMEKKSGTLKVCHTTFQGNIGNTCSQYMAAKKNMIIGKKTAKVGCGLSFNDNYVFVCCLYK